MEEILCRMQKIQKQKGFKELRGCKGIPSKGSSLRCPFQTEKGYRKRRVNLQNPKNPLKNQESRNFKNTRIRLFFRLLRVQKNRGE